MSAARRDDPETYRPYIGGTYFETWDRERPRCDQCGHVWVDHRGPLEPGRGNWVGCIEIIFTDDGIENCECECIEPAAFDEWLSWLAPSVSQIQEKESQ